MKKIEFNFENVGGLAEIYAFPPDDFLRLRHDYVSGSDSLELLTRDNIIAIPVFGDRSFLFYEEKEQAAGGDYWDLSIEGVIPNINKDNQQLLDTLSRGDWLVVSRTTMGWYICPDQQKYHSPSLIRRQQATLMPLSMVWSSHSRGSSLRLQQSSILIHWPTYNRLYTLICPVSRLRDGTFCIVIFA